MSIRESRNSIPRVHSKRTRDNTVCQKGKSRIRISETSNNEAALQVLTCHKLLLKIHSQGRETASFAEPAFEREIKR